MWTVAGDFGRCGAGLDFLLLHTEWGTEEGQLWRTRQGSNFLGFGGLVQSSGLSSPAESLRSPTKGSGSSVETLVVWGLVTSQIWDWFHPHPPDPDSVHGAPHSLLPIPGVPALPYPCAAKPTLGAPLFLLSLPSLKGLGH